MKYKLEMIMGHLLGLRENKMKVTKSYLKQVIKEELDAMGEAGYKTSREGGHEVREVSITLNGKTAHVSFSEAGGSPLIGGDDLSPAEEEVVMRMARAAAEMKTNDDYSEDDIKSMMGGGKVSPFKEAQNLGEGMVYCSQCGEEFDIPGKKTGFSHCDTHKGKKSTGR